MQPSAIGDWIEVARSRRLLSGINAINAPTYRPDISSIQDRARPVRVCKLATGHMKHRVNIGTLLTRKLRSARSDKYEARSVWFKGILRANSSIGWDDIIASLMNLFVEIIAYIPERRNFHLGNWTHVSLSLLFSYYVTGNTTGIRKKE